MTGTVLPGWAGHGLCLLYPRCLCLLPQDRVPPRAGRGGHEEAVPRPVLHVPHLPSPAGRAEVLPERWAPPVRTLLPGEPPRLISRCQALSWARGRRYIISSPQQSWEVGTIDPSPRGDSSGSERRGSSAKLCLFPVASVTTHHKLGGSNSTRLSSYSSRGQKSKISFTESQSKCHNQSVVLPAGPGSLLSNLKLHPLHSLVPLSGFKDSREHPSASYKDTCDGI